MAKDTSKIVIGQSSFNIGTYVTAGGAGSLADAGHIKGGIEIAGAFEDYAIETDHAYGPLKLIPQKGEITVKVPMHQAEVENLRVGLRQPTANKSGTGSNLTLLVGDHKEQYHQATIVGVAGSGPGTTGVRTWTFWKLAVRSIEPIAMKKDGEQMVIVTMVALYDDSVATADKFGKVVDA